ncbi:hypothetical protein R3X27_09880 [Tropicimonas sp. TH_r6]|uniref:hypothetical protein n=1 Tax=Tropicimonas sp. TH_r6 TaxID=3082085 RepID=UPI0029548349|nr:hypothetical protein [Tropicimonas sp. TH_r6]MDV7142995.1 hypothetical protein [Tropicimonas sp. TH_r6]
MSDAAKSLLRDVRDSLYVDQPYLDIATRDEAVVVEGIYLLLAKLPAYRDRGPLAEHRIRIEIPADYPATEPRVTMLDDSLPRHESFHCSTSGVCCVTVFETWVVTQKDPSIGAFLEGPLRNFFLSQLLRRKGKDWPFEEWNHGVDGWIDAVAELIGCRPRKTEVRNILERRRDDDPLDMRAECPCGARVSATDCCGPSLQDFWMQVSAETAELWLRRMVELTPTLSPHEIQQKIHRNRPFRRVH